MIASSIYVALLGLAMTAHALPQNFNGNRFGGRQFGGGRFGGGNGGNNNNNGNNGNNNNNNNGGNNGGNNNGGDPQQSLTLNPAVIASGFANDGQDVPAAGQVASLTSTNNFINFCLTRPDLPITNGKQIETGSCNPAPIGAIPSTDNMPSSKFTSPANGDFIAANQAFTVSMAIQKMQTGNFVNAQENYFAAPQQLNGAGQIIGHTHLVIEDIGTLGSTQVTDAKKFVFFKGINGAAVNGVVTADVTDGVPAGVYRMCSINAAANHQPVIVPIAQHGFLDDCVYFTANNGGNNNNNGGNNGQNGGNNNNGQNGGNNNGQNGGNNNGQNGGNNNNGQGNSGNNGGNGGNLQTFTGSLGGAPPAVTVGGRGFQVAGSDSFLNSGSAIQRSCSIQHNACADKANSGGGFAVSQCDQQETQCNALIDFSK